MPSRCNRSGIMERHGGCGRSVVVVVVVVMIAMWVGAKAVAVAAPHEGRASLQAFRKSKSPRRDYSAKGDSDRQTFFEVTKPLDVPAGAVKLCSHLLIHQTFANTIADPPALRHYTPPPHPECGYPRDWTLIALRWHATCTGRQFDRIAAVWLSGAEIFRTCTAEPTPYGIVWTVEKDVTRFRSLFALPQLLALELANVVDDTYTGIYNVTLTAQFYGTSSPHLLTDAADLILPFARPSPLDGGHWFQLQNESDVQSRHLELPRNAYRAILEICVSFHGPDEFWYTNPPNEFLVANNLTDSVAGNGTFREVLVSIDENLVGILVPFPVLYTGGIDPYFWRPVSAIGSFLLPSYDVDVTPVLPTLLDSRPHRFSATVTNALPYWLLGVNLHLWLDPKGPTFGSLTHHSASPLTAQFTSTFHNLDGKFSSFATRSVSFQGYVVSKSVGNLTTTASYSYRFANTLVYSRNATVSEVRHESNAESKVVVKDAARDLVYAHSRRRFPLRVAYAEINHPNKTVHVSARIEHAWEEETQVVQSTKSAGSYSSSSFSWVRNKQKSHGELLVPEKGPISGVATTRQRYSLESSEGCYSRCVGVRNYTFLYDQSDRRCTSVAPTL